MPDQPKKTQIRKRISEDIRASRQKQGMEGMRKEGLGWLQKMMIPAMALQMANSAFSKPLEEGGTILAHWGQEGIKPAMRYVIDKLDPPPTITQAPAKPINGKALIIGQNHFKVEATNSALPELARAGAKFFALELPSNYDAPLQKYLKSSRTHDDRVKLSQETILATQLHPDMVEATRAAKEAALLSITGTKHTVTSEAIIKDALQEFSKSPDQWTNTLKVALHMAEIAHDCGMQTVCIDKTTINPQELNAFIMDPITREARMESRNQEMARNIARLATKGNVVAAVGGAHTGRGNHTSVEEQTRKFGVKCLSVDTDNLTGPSEEKTTSSNALSKSDRVAITPKQIIDVYKSLTPTKAKSMQLSIN